VLDEAILQFGASGWRPAVGKQDGTAVEQGFFLVSDAHTQPLSALLPKQQSP
jgi:hypothetical protein